MARKYVNNGTRNLTILNYLTNVGTWKNHNQITTGTGNYHPSDVKIVLNDFLIRKYVQERPAENPQAKTEYHITENGRKMTESLNAIFATSGIKHMLGIDKDKSK